ncbi:MAG: hypothetical protein IJT48_00945, partial [Bacteroidaceae bacterium]|nr:hypothetical protein [Bacteroidaceae bacterium]
RKFPGMTRWDVLCECINPMLQPLDKITLARYIGERVETSIRRNSTVKVCYEDWWLSDTSVLEKLRPNDYKVTAYWLPVNDGLNGADGLPEEIYLFQGDRYIDTCERVITYNRVMAEQTEDDMVNYIEQRKKIAKFEAYVREHEIESVGIAPSQPTLTGYESEDLELVAAEPPQMEQAVYVSVDTEGRAVADM